MSKSSGISSDSSYEAGMLMLYKDGVIIDPREAENRHMREADIDLDVPEEEEEADDELNQAFIGHFVDTVFQSIRIQFLTEHITSFIIPVA